jgi:hypothetical protein
MNSPNGFEPPLDHDKQYRVECRNESRTLKIEGSNPFEPSIRLDC